MIKKNNLFELIKALSASEKRYFKRTFARAETRSKNYLRLFDAIDKMDQYNEQEIKQKFRGAAFTRQLHVTKIYLQDSILTCLRRYYASASSSLLLKDRVKNIEICFNKELYNQCALEIQRAEKTARQYEDDIALLEILNWKRKLIQARSPAVPDIKNLLAEQQHALTRLQQVNALWQGLVNEASDHCLSQPSSGTSLTAKVLHYHISYRTCIRNNDHTGAAEALTSLVSLLEQYPYRIADDPSLYLSTLNNLLGFLVFAKKYKEALLILPKAKIFYQHVSDTKRNKNNLRLMLRTYNIELEIYRDTESLEEAGNLIREIQSMISQHAEKVPAAYLVSLWFQFAYIFFLKADYKKALHWINTILNAPFAEARKDLYLQTHFLNLMVHAELRNFFVMRYFVGNAKRFFIRNQASGAYHKLILSFFMKISSAPETEHKELFAQLYANLAVERSMVSPRDLDYINWNRWILTKLKRC